MKSFRDKAIFGGVLGAIFVVTLTYAYGPGYGSNLEAVLGISIQKSPASTSIIPKMSPGDMVTNMVTNKNVTNVTIVSPKMSPIENNNQGTINIISPTVFPSTTQMSPVLSPLSPSHTPQASLTIFPSLSPVVLTTSSPPISTVVQTVVPTQTAINQVNGGGVVINEVAWMGTIFSANDEWLELYNSSSSPVSLDGWTLNSITGSSPDPKITLTGAISAHGYVVLERTDDTTISDISALKIYTGALNDSGEALELRDNKGNLIDAISKLDNAWFAGDRNSRASMERISPFISGSQASNWATHNSKKSSGHDAANPSNQINGTPGSVNSVSSP